MRYTITGSNIVVTPGLRAAIEEKIGKLDRYFNPDTEVTVSYTHLDVYKRQSQAHTVSDTGEVFANDVSQVLEYLISEADRLIGKPVAQMKREDKIEFIRFLDKKGAFLITKASEKVYEHLKISRFTLYNYLDAVRRDSDSIPPEEMCIRDR